MSDAIHTLDSTVIIDFSKAVAEFLSVLSSREKDILEKRFKLQPGMEKRFTLEDIGKLYDITRERVRQIEADSIRKLREIPETDDVKRVVFLVRDAMDTFLRKEGGALKENFLLESLMKHFWHPQAELTASEQREYIDALHFIISQLLHESFDPITSKEEYHPVWKVKELDWQIVGKFIECFVHIIDREHRPLKEEEILSLLKQHEEYHDLEQKLLLQVQNLHEQVASFDDILRSYLSMSRKIKKNLFHEWGLVHWNTISPKKINDKIYLILKKAGNPLHFNDITELINQAQFDHKHACTATVHNELILDTKYVLVGRGMYALREWGYQPGTVTEIITRILKERGPMQKTEIIEAVQKQRLVKQATVNLALMNKNFFQRLSDGRYIVKSQEGEAHSSSSTEEAASGALMAS